MNYKSAYFIGIGGAGMSALARFLHRNGTSVSGYDRVRSRLCEKLEEEGILITYDDSIDSIPESIISAPSNEVLIVFTPAIPDTHPQLQHFKTGGYELIKRAKLLGEIAPAESTLAVAGTHGKTTASCILAHILSGTEAGCNAFLGGIAAAHKSNLYTSEKALWTVVEADEFDRSFHHLSPTHSIITSTDPDHLDVYGTEEKFIEAFDIYRSKVSSKTIAAAGVTNLDGISEFYGTSPSSDTPNLTHFATDIAPHPTGITCTISLGAGSMVIPNIDLPMYGAHNLENAVGAAALAYYSGATAAEIAHGLSTFPGVYRRFQIHTNTPDLVYIDDYAHHPTEIKKAIEGVRNHFPGRHLTVIFQPHLYSRTADQLEGFCEELSKSDSLILLPIYPARELPIEGVNTQLILNNISHPHAKMSTINSIFENLKVESLDVILTLGAGDIDTLVPALCEFTASN